MNLLYDMFATHGIILNGHFKLSKGGHSDMYINKDAIYSKPRLFQAVVDIMIGRLKAFPPGKNLHFDIVTGPAIAGAVLAAPIALKLQKSFVYPEKGFDANGTRAMIFNRGYDKVLKGKKVVIVEDVVTTGASIEKTLVAVTQCGGLVVNIVALWTRSPMDEISYKFASYEVDYYSILDKEIKVYNDPEYCPQCKLGVPLIDPKTNIIC